MKRAMLVALLSTATLYAQDNQSDMNSPMNAKPKSATNEQADNSSNGTKAQMNDQASTNQMPQSGGEIVWMDNYDQALQTAAQSNKPVILYFTGSDWCGWCKKMDQEVFSSPAFAEDVANKFVFVKVDFPMNSKLPETQARQNAQLKQRYGVTGYPTVVIVDSKGGFIGETGYRAGGGKAYALWLEQFLSH